MAMLVKPVDRNPSLPMLWSRLPLAKLTLARLEAPWKALFPILVTEEGMTMLVKPDPENAKSHILDSWLSLANVTVLNVVHPRNATGEIVIIEAGTKTLPVGASGTIKHWLTPVFENA